MVSLNTNYSKTTRQTPNSLGKWPYRDQSYVFAEGFWDLPRFAEVSFDRWFWRASKFKFLTYFHRYELEKKNKKSKTPMVVMTMAESSMNNVGLMATSPGLCSTRVSRSFKESRTWEQRSQWLNLVGLSNNVEINTELHRLLLTFTSPMLGDSCASSRMEFWRMMSVVFLWCQETLTLGFPLQTMSSLWKWLS